MKLLTEMAYPKSVAINKFQQFNEKRIEHLMLVYFYVDNESVDHWLNEICAWSKFSYRIKPRNKLMRSSTIYDLIWLQPKDSINVNSVKTRLKNFHTMKHLPLILEFDLNNLIEYLDSFFLWLSEQLSKNDEVDAERIKKYILGLVNIYS